MLNKLAFRNMKRSTRDYLVYLLTMTVVTALMYSFNSLFFQNELASCFGLGNVDVMSTMIGLATVFIVLIVAWLIHYMVHFMLEKRSTEFGIYLLLGMKKKTVSRLYVRENLLLGALAFLPGCLLGILLQQILFTVMFSMVQMEYHMHIRIDRRNILVTLLCYAGCYLLALRKCRRKVRKMNIQALMNARRQNEEIKEKHEEGKRVILPLSILFIFLFWALFGRLSGSVQILLFLVGLVLTIYLFYTGLSAWIICYVRKKGGGIYRGQNLFLLRQFASKIRTMQFTLGTLTSLFTLALMGASIALMFSTYENTVLDDKFPFDIQMHSGNSAYDFAREKDLLTRQGVDTASYTYQIYTDRDNQANAWILTHLEEWGDMFRQADGTPDMAGIETWLTQEGWYYPYDTYMGLSDYNRLRAMLGYDEAALGSGEFLIHIKPRLEREVQEMGAALRIADTAGGEFLSCAGILAEPFSQDGHNGADYLLVVPDAVLARMEPYYTEMAADILGETPTGLQDLFDDLEEDDEELPADFRGGSDNIIAYTGLYLIRDDLIPFMQYMLGSLILPLFYIGLVFVCVAMTVLAVQQLSDSAKYKFRYDVLGKLGLDRRHIRGLILRQLAAYYLCPALLAVVISGKMILFVSGRFVDMTGVPTSIGGFFLKSTALFFGIYLVYFIVTYVGFTRNVEEKGSL